MSHAEGYWRSSQMQEGRLANPRSATRAPTSAPSGSMAWSSCSPSASSSPALNGASAASSPGSERGGGRGSHQAFPTLADRRTLSPQVGCGQRSGKARGRDGFPGFRSLRRNCRRPRTPSTSTPKTPQNNEKSNINNEAEHHRTARRKGVGWCALFGSSGCSPTGRMLAQKVS